MRPINLARLREPTFVQRKLTEMQKSRDANFSDIRSDNRSVSRTELIVVLVSADLLLWYVVQKMIPKQKEGECTPGAGEKGRGWWKRTLVPERPGLKNSIWNQSGFWERVKGKERVMRMRRVSVVEGSGPGEGDVTSVFIIEAWALEEQILQRLGAV